MSKDEALKLALKALQSDDYWTHVEAVNAIHKALAQPEQEPVQVSPLDFVTMTLEKEHLVGRPIIWAQWPNEEKNT